MTQFSTELLNFLAQKQAIDAYIDGQNASLLLLFHSVREQIIKRI